MNNTTQETSVTSSQDRFTAVEVLKKVIKTNGEKTKSDFTNVTKTSTSSSTSNSSSLSSTIEELFPWIIEFKKKCRCLLAQPNIVALIKLMKFYSRNVSINVNECYTKPYRAAKLKDSISETLLFFLFYFRELVEVCDKNSYLDKMSDLLAMYLDMELKASRRGKEHHSKIAARLTSCLYVYLENSTEHILDTFIKARFINRNYHDILDPVLTKISKNLPSLPLNCDTMYVRYLLIYRLWKKVNNDAAVKNEINTTAISQLGAPPVNPTPFLAKYVLPKVPKSQANSTKFLLLHKFDIEKSCRLFIQYCKENREDEEQGDIDKPNFNAIGISSDNLETLGSSGICRGTNHVENLIDNVNIQQEGEKRQRIGVQDKFLGQECVKKGPKNIGKIETAGDNVNISTLKQFKSGKVLPRLKTKKNGDILFIDLTADEITEKVIKKKKHLKLHWLTEVKKKLNSKSIKAADRKKKEKNQNQNLQSIDNNLSDELNLSGFVDSTSAGSFSTTTTPEPIINPGIVESLANATTPESENFVTSNFAENHFDLELKSQNLIDDEVSRFAEKHAISCDVTTTVEESLIRKSCNEDSFFPEQKFNQIDNTDQLIADAKSSCHTTSQKDEISSLLPHIYESYDSDNSAIHPRSKENLNSGPEEDESGTIGGEIELPGDEKVFENMEIGEESEKSGDRTLRNCSENSEVAVIFTRRASDVEIVNLDDYNEDNIEKDDKIESENKEENVCSSSDMTIDDNNLEFETTEVEKNCESSEVRDLASRTGEMSLTNSFESLVNSGELSNGHYNEKDKAKERINGILNKRELSNIPISSKLIDSEKANDSKDGNLMKLEQRMIKMDRKESEIDENISQTLSKSSKIVEKRCDYNKSSFKGDETVDKKAPIIRKEYIEERRTSMIPKINEILICNNKNEIPNNEEEESPRHQFNDNIDGLSLLASVSQHVSNMEEYCEKILSKPNKKKKIIEEEEEEIRLPQINTCYDMLLEPKKNVHFNVNIKNNNITNEDIQVPDHRYQPKDNKLSYDGDVKLKIEENFGKTYSPDVVPLILETNVDLNSSKLLKNSLISVENVTQMIKESTNVIVNGETVVLFQKSPNSNLYIINKAADDSKREYSDKKDKDFVKYNEEKSSATVNLSEKNIERQELEDVKDHRSINDKKLVHYSSPKKYENRRRVMNSSKEFNKPIIDNEILYIKKEIFNEESYVLQRSTDTPGSVVELEPVDKSPPPIIRLSDTPIDIKMIKNHDKDIRDETSIAINMITATRRSEEDGKRIRRIEKSHEEGITNESFQFNKHKQQNIKKEFDNNRSDYHQRLLIEKQNYDHLFSVNSILSSKMPQFCNNEVVNSSHNFYNIEREEGVCNYYDPSYNNSKEFNSSSQSYESVDNCQLANCSCTKCAYEVHGAQFIQREATNNSFYSQTNSYFLTTDDDDNNTLIKSSSTVLNRGMIDHSKIVNDDDRDKNIVKTVIEKEEEAKNNIKYKKEFENKLPLKKRLKAHAMLSAMNSEEVSSVKPQPTLANIKIERIENYPGIPMMSIAALETRNIAQSSDNKDRVYDDDNNDKSTPSNSNSLELSPSKVLKDDSNYNLNSNNTREMIRRDYLKDTSLQSIGNCANVVDYARRNNTTIGNSHINIMGMTGRHRSFKTPAQRKEVVTVSSSLSSSSSSSSSASSLSLKRNATGVLNHPKSPKKGKKSKKTVTGNCRQTRSSKRNIPKVDYSYDGIIDTTDIKCNKSVNELRRKRKIKTSR